MSKFLHSLFVLLATATDRELAQAVQYLREENRILRAKLPKRIVVTPRERRRLLRYGRPIGSAIKNLISIVSPRTFLRWLHAEREAKGHASKGSGRPRTMVDVEQLILKLARETGWGSLRILGELRRLGVYSSSRSTVGNILRRNGIEPAPERGPGTWSEFVQRHAQTLWACDFLSVRSWTAQGVVDLYLLVFIHVGSRRIWVSRATAQPDARWVEQQARNMCMAAQDDALSARYLIRDRDAKFTRGFDDVFRGEGIIPLKLPPRSPNLNAFCERVILTLKYEALNHFVILGRRHLDHIVKEFVAYYHEFRPHQGIRNVPPHPPPTEDAAKAPDELQTLNVVCHERLGGLLKRYERRAA